MESVIKTSGSTHPVSDNDEKWQENCHSNGDKTPFLWNKDAGLCCHKLIPMELANKTSGCTYPERDNDKKRQKQQ